MTWSFDPAVALVNLSAVWICCASSTRSNWFVLPDLSGSTKAKPLGQELRSTRFTESLKTRKIVSVIALKSASKAFETHCVKYVCRKGFR